jgi:neutral trehalase
MNKHPFLPLILSEKIDHLTRQIKNLFWRVHKNTIPNSQKTYYVYATNIKQLMLFKETMSVDCENHMKYTDTRCWRNAVLVC